MFGRYQDIFRSRWRALMWSLGVLVTAYCTVPAPDEAPKEKTVAEHRHSNPWALDRPADR